jgi:hypothetical protein
MVKSGEDRMSRGRDFCCFGSLAPVLKRFGLPFAEACERLTHTTVGIANKINSAS